MAFQDFGCSSANDNVADWPIATNFSLGRDVSFRGKADVPVSRRSSFAPDNERERATVLRCRPC